MEGVKPDFTVVGDKSSCKWWLDYIAAMHLWEAWDAILSPTNLRHTSK